MAIEVDVNDNGTIDIEYGGTNASTASGARTNLGLGTAAELDAGSAVGEVVVILADQKLPVLDGSNLINVQPVGGGVTSVNTQTGVVVLDADDISDGTNYAIITKVEQANVANNTLVVSRLENLEDYVDDAEASAAAALVSETNAAASASDASDSAEEAATLLGTIPLSAGMLEAPVYTDHANGSITINAEDCNLFSTTDHTGQLSRFSIVADTFVLADNDTTYITVNYNTGTPIYVATTVVDGINESDVIPVYTINRNGVILSIMSWDGLGVGLSNKLHARFVKTDRLKRESGLALSESATRVVEVGAGVVWVGAASNIVNAFASNVNSLRLFYHTAGAWASSIVTQYDNTQYDDGTNLQALGTAKYGVNWVFRNVSEDCCAGVVLGGGSYNLAEALDSTLPASLPENILAQGILVGRIIVQKDATSSAVIQSAFTTGFAAAAAVQQHNDLAGLQGGSAGDYQHLTTSELAQISTNESAIGDLNILNQVTTEADFMARAAANRDKFGGSGFVEMGKQQPATTAVEHINQGLFAYNSLANRLYLGNAEAWSDDTDATSKTQYPTVHINGMVFPVKEANSTVAGTNLIGFPDAPIAEDLVINGTFDTNTDWTLGTGFTISGGTLIGTLVPLNSVARSTIFNTEVGKEYLVSIDTHEISAGSYRLYYRDISNASYEDYINLVAGQTQTLRFTALGALAEVRIYSLSADSSGIFDNISTIDLGKVERQDLVFLESWHEKVADKNIVYPYGNIQSLLATDPSTGLTTVNGSFTGYGTYSLFGNWQASHTLIGNGLVWSTMTDANKKKFVSDPENNVYLAEDGELVQVRYRIRVVEGLGADWENIDPQSVIGFSYNSSADYIIPKGASTSLSYDMGSPIAAQGNYFMGSLATTTLTEATKDTGVFGMRTESVTLAYKGLCFALPIALVSRRNQGAFHPVFNPNGTAEFWDDANATNSVSWYESNSKKPSSTTDCFSFGTVVTLGNNPPFTSGVWGDIDSAIAMGRPDGKYYDAIYESDVLDLRNSSHKQDLTRTLEREFNKLVAGETRGWEKQWNIVEILDITVFTKTTVTRWGGTSTIVVDDAASIIDNTFYDTDTLIDDHSAFLVGNDGVYYEIAGILDTGADTNIYLHPASGDVTTNWTNSSAYKLVIAKSQSIPAKTLLQCDIIGDPVNYFRGHYDFLSSVGSQAIVTGDIIKVLLGYNEHTTDPGIVGHFYERIGGDGTYDLSAATYGNITVYKDLGTDLTGSWITNGVMGTPLLVGEEGEDLIPDGLGQEFKLSRKPSEAALLLSLDSSDNGVTWVTASTAVGSANNLFRGASTPIAVGNLVMLFYLTEASPFEVAGNAEVLALWNVFVSNNVDNNALSGLLGKVLVGSDRSTYQLQQYLIEADLDTVDVPKHSVIDVLTDNLNPALKTLPYLTRENGKLFLQTLFKEMKYDVDWGDDSKFNVANGVSTTTDDNSNTVLIGQKRLELPYFIGDGE